MDFAGTTYDAGVVVYYDGFFPFVAFYILHFKNRNRADVHAYRVAVTFAPVDFNFNHFGSPEVLKGLCGFWVINFSKAAGHS